MLADNEMIPGRDDLEQPTPSHAHDAGLLQGAVKFALILLDLDRAAEAKDGLQKALAEVLAHDAARHAELTDWFGRRA